MPLLRAHRERAHSRLSDELHPESIRCSLRGTLEKATGAMFAFLLAALVGCGPSQDSNSHNVVAGSSKPDLADLSDRMVITESEFPPVGDGEFMFIPVQTVDIGGGADTDKCDPDGWAREGDQSAGRSVFSEGALLYAISIRHFQARPNMVAWANDCLPRTEENVVMDRIDLPGLPPGTITVEFSENFAPLTYEALGYVRGLQVHAVARAVHTGRSTPAEAKSALVEIFTNQAERLESY